MISVMPVVVFSLYWTDIHILHYQAENSHLAKSLFIQGLSFSKNLPKTILILKKIHLQLL